MKRWMVLALLAGCAAPTPRQQQTLAVLCRVDAVAQPVIVALAPIAGPIGSAGAVADNVLVHPAVVTACAKVNGTPTAVVAVAPAAIPVAPPVSSSSPSVSGIQAP